MSEQFTYDVFISHSEKDKPAVRELAERLRRDGLRVWFDEWAIKPGDSIPLRIQDGLEQARTLVLFLWRLNRRSLPLSEFGIQRMASFSEKLKRPSEILDVTAAFGFVFLASISVKPKAFGEISLEIGKPNFVASGLLCLPPSAS